MKKRLDEYSRVVIPSSYLKELGIEKGELLNVNLGDDKIELSKAKNIKTPLEEAIDEATEFIIDACWYPELEEYSNMTNEEVKELLEILKKAKKN